MGRSMVQCLLPLGRSASHGMPSSLHEAGAMSDSDVKGRHPSLIQFVCRCWYQCLVQIYGLFYLFFGIGAKNKSQLVGNSTFYGNPQAKASNFLVSLRKHGRSLMPTTWTGSFAGSPFEPSGIAGGCQPKVAGQSTGQSLKAKKNNVRES